MSINAQNLLAEVEGAEELAIVDLSTSSTGGGFKLYPEGYAFARLVKYVEFGNHENVIQGKSKGFARRTQLGFAIWGQPAGQEETYHNEDGSPGFIRPYDLYLKATSNNVKAGVKKGFDKMNWQNKHQQFWQMLGEPFLLKVGIKKGEGDKKDRNTIKLEEIMPPVDPVSGTPYQVPELPSDFNFQLFLWDKPTKACWESIFIEGENDEGKSKNWMQELCYEAQDFEGSPLQTMLGGVSYDPRPTEQEQKTAAAPVEDKAAPAAETAKVDETAGPTAGQTAIPDVPAIPDLPTV